VLALDCSEERCRPLPIMVAMTMATITPRMPVHPHLRFGIGAIPTRAITPRYLNARFRGDKLFSSHETSPLSGGVKPQCGLLNIRSDLTWQLQLSGDVRQVRMPPGTACTLV
jgi:hypothetical protein